MKTSMNWGTFIKHVLDHKYLQDTVTFNIRYV